MADNSSKHSIMASIEEAKESALSLVNQCDFEGARSILQGVEEDAREAGIYFYDLYRGVCGSVVKGKVRTAKKKGDSIKKAESVDIEEIIIFQKLMDDLERIITETKQETPSAFAKLIEMAYQIPVNYLRNYLPSAAPSELREKRGEIETYLNYVESYAQMAGIDAESVLDELRKETYVGRIKRIVDRVKKEQNGLDSIGSKKIHDPYLMLIYPYDKIYAALQELSELVVDDEEVGADVKQMCIRGHAQTKRHVELLIRKKQPQIASAIREIDSLYARISRESFTDSIAPTLKNVDPILKN